MAKLEGRHRRWELIIRARLVPRVQNFRPLLPIDSTLPPTTMSDSSNMNTGSKRKRYTSRKATDAKARLREREQPDYI